MKIGFFLPNATFDLPGAPEVGGIETFAFTVGEALLELGHEVVLFGGEPKPGRRHRETSIPLRLFPYIETKSIPDIGTRFQRLVQRLHFGWMTRRAWRAERFDAALVFKPFDWPVAWRWKARQPELRVIMNFQGTDWFAFDRRFYRYVDAAFAVSPQTADLAEQHLGSRPPVVPNPADLKNFAPASAGETRATTGPLRLAASGRLIGWKGFANLIEAVDRVRSDGLDVEAELAGKGPERDALEALIRERGLEDHFRLVGLLDTKELRDLLQRADAYVAPSIGMDAGPLAVCEAGAAGLPLLLSDQIGQRPMLSAADYLDYPARDVDALARGIHELAARRGDPAWTDRQARHNRFRELFDPESVARRIVALIETV
ncbi:MAG: glycosyltransferase family 4 protein [Verrucomicrobiota bacterium]